MSRAHRIGNLIGVVLPPIGLVMAVVLLWNAVVGWTDVAVLAAMYVLTGLGVTVGFHRLFTHRAFETYAAVRGAFAILGSMALEGRPIKWVADHRKHHAYADEDGDPHSPHVGHGGGWRGAVKGLWHAHVGWLFRTVGLADMQRYARDLLADRAVRAMDRLFWLWVVLGFALPFAMGWLVGGTLGTGLTALLWGGLVRVFLLHHVTWSINSVCHFFGRRRFRTDDESRNVFWLAPISFGESWHHNHHAFPRSAFHGLRRFELDPGGLLIVVLEKLGLAWNVVRVSAESQRAKALT